MAGEQIRRETARQYLTKKYGSDRGFVAMTETSFTFVHDRRVVEVRFDSIRDTIRREAVAVVRHEQGVA